MLKENKKMKSSMMKEEKLRISQLVEQAYKYDPRIMAETNRIEQEKEKLRLERIAQRQKEKEQEEERVKELKRQSEEKIKRAQEQQVKDKQMLLSSVINVASELGITLSKEDVFHITLNAKIETMKSLMNELDSKENQDDKVKIYKNMTSSYFGLKFPDEHLENSLWKKDEIIALQKAVKKFPAGTKNRWEKIVEIVKTKSTNQVIQMTHYLTTNPSIKIDSDIVSSYFNYIGSQCDFIEEQEAC